MKSKKEVEFDKLCDKYREKFGVPFPVMITAGFNLNNKITELKACIENNKPAKEFEYDDGVDY